VPYDIQQDVCDSRIRKLFDETKMYRSTPTILLYEYCNDIIAMISYLKYRNCNFSILNSSHASFNFDWSPLSTTYASKYKFMLDNNYIKSENVCF
jgi:hypothetical protein